LRAEFGKSRELIFFRHGHRLWLSLENWLERLWIGGGETMTTRRLHISAYKLKQAELAREVYARELAGEPGPIVAGHLILQRAKVLFQEPVCPFYKPKKG